MVVVNKVDYIRVKTLENTDISYLSDYDRYNAGVEFNGKTFSFLYSNVKDISGLEITKDLYIKIKAFYKTLDKDNKQYIFNEIMLNIAELIFRLRVDLGVEK